jgi:hypothetical protein
MRSRLFPLLLGFRLLRGHGRAGWLRVALIAFGTALCVVVLLLSLAVPTMLGHRADRDDARTVYCQYAAGRTAEPCDLLGFPVADAWDGVPLRRQLVDAGADVTRLLGPPPGVTRLPQAHEIVVSPALKQLYDAPRNAVLRQRFDGAVIGIIGAAGLKQPDELLAYVGVPAGLLEATQPGTGYGASRSNAGPAPKDTAPVSATAAAAQRKQAITVVTAVIVGLTPVLLFLAACARLSSATRDRRLAALRLLGLTPRQTQVVNAAETGLAATLGALAGLAAFEVLRLASGNLTVGGYGWFVADLQPPAWQVALLLVAVPVLAMTVGAFAGRSATGAITTARSDGIARKLRLWRLLPLCCGIAILGFVTTGSHPSVNMRGSGGTILEEAGIIATLLGLASAPPLLARQLSGGLGRMSRRVWAELGARRLRFEAASAARPVIGLVLLVFVGVFGASVAEVTKTKTQVGDWRHNMAAGTYQVEMRTSMASPVIPASTLSAVPGVRAVVPVVRVEAAADAGSVATADAGSGPSPQNRLSVLAMTCAQLSQVVKNPPAHCVEGQAFWSVLHRVSPQSAVSTYSVPITAASDTGAPRAITVPAPTGMLDIDPNNSRLIADLIITGDPALQIQAAHQPRWRDAYVVATDGSRAALDALDTAAARFNPMLTASIPDTTSAADYQLPLYSVLLEVGAVLTLVIGLGSVAVTTADRALERRREVAMQAATGVPLGTMRAAQLMQILVPYFLGVALATAAGVLGGRSYAATVGVRYVLPGTDLVGAGVLILVGAVLVGLSALPGLSRGIRVEYLRRE